jgi:hypothetical protein
MLKSMPPEMLDEGTRGGRDVQKDPCFRPMASQGWLRGREGMFGQGSIESQSDTLTVGTSI